MTMNFRNPVSLPSNLTKELDAYLEEDEEIVDAIRETLVLAIDFRWLILTSQRVIIAVAKFLSIEFRDVHYDGIDMQLTKGFFYDDLHLKSLTDNYHAQFYSFGRRRTETFLQEMEDERDYFQKEKKKMEKMVEQEAMEELGSKGPLDEPRVRHDILVDIDHNKNILDKRMEGKRSGLEEKMIVKNEFDDPEVLEDFGENEPHKKEDEVGPQFHEEAQAEEGEQASEKEQPNPKEDSSCNSVKTIKELKELLDEGTITQDEFEQKKQDLLKRI